MSEATLDAAGHCFNPAHGDCTKTKHKSLAQYFGNRETRSRRLFRFPRRLCLLGDLPVARRIFTFMVSDFSIGVRQISSPSLPGIHGSICSLFRQLECGCGRKNDDWGRLSSY